MKNNQTQKNSSLWLIAAIVIVGGIAWGCAQSAPTETIESKPAPAATAQATPVKYPTLPPSMFTGKTREAYQIAMDIPEVLKEVSCYCGCNVTDGHKNNLYCFMDQHGTECNMCQDIAFDSKKMHDAGIPTSQIREAIRIKYERSGQ